MQRGVRPRLLERDRETRDAICGGFMSWKTLGALAGISFHPPQGHPLAQVALFASGRTARAPLPGPAIGLSRRALDTAMQAAVERQGVEIERGVEVREIDATALRLADGTTVNADAIFLASGKHDVRGVARPRDADDPTLGLRVRIAAHPELAKLIGDAIELHLFDRCYVGINLQEDGSANLCLAVRKSRLTEAGGRPEQLLRMVGNAAPLGDRLAFADLGDVDAIASVPYGWRATATAPGLYRLGDQAAVIPSLAGEGIGIAIASGIAAASAYADGKSAEAYQGAFAGRTHRPVNVARLLWAGAENARVARYAVPLLARFPAMAGFAARLTRIGD